MDNDFLQALILGIAIMLAIFIGLNMVQRARDLSTRRAYAIFGAAVGLISTFYLAERPALLDEYLFEVVGAGVAVLVALLWFVRRGLR